MYRLSLLAAALLALVLPLQAQFDQNGPNARQFVQDKVGSVVDPVDHDVDVMLPGTFKLRVESGTNPNVPLTTLMSTVQPFPGVIPTPWGGSIDVGIWNPVTVLSNTTILGDGISFSGALGLDAFFFTNSGNPFTGAGPTFELTAQFSAAAIPPGQSSVTRAFQTIVFDPTAAPLNLDNTEAIDANFRVGQAGVLKTGDDGFITVPLLSGGFPFHGTVYNSVTVCANGFVTFGGPPTTMNLGADGDHVAWLNDRPSIAALLCDWDPSANSAQDGVYYEEANGQVTITWGDPRAQVMGGISHAGDNDLNFFRLTLTLADGLNANPGRFQIETISLDPGAGALYGNGLIGHGPGGAAILGGGFDVGLRSSSRTVGAKIAQIEEHDRSATNVANLGFDGSGQRRCYNDITIQWDNASIAFQPVSGGLVPGDMGYVSQPTMNPAPDDASSLSAPSIAKTGNQTVTLCGSFGGFASAGAGPGSVVFDPQGLQGGPYPATVVGILDSTSSVPNLSLPNPQPGRHRDLQGLRIVTPPMPGVGTQVSCRLSFQSGAQVDIQVPVTTTPGPFTAYSLDDDNAVPHNLSVPIRFYGQDWNTVFIGSNGYVTFGAGSNANSGGPAAIDAGLAAPSTPAVAALFTDLNPFGTASGAIYEVTEDIAQGRVEVTFRNMLFWTTIEFAGTVRLRFGYQGLGSVEIDYSGYFPAVAGTGLVTFGVSDGNFATPYSNFSNGFGSGLYQQTLAGGGLGFLSPQGGHSILESFPRNVDPPFTSLVFKETATSAPFGIWLVE